MNRLTSWLQNFLVRVVLTTLLVGIAVLGFGNQLTAQAVPFSAEAATYQGNRTDTDNELSKTGNQQVDNPRQNLKDTADNIREKLNLDEPIPQSTKDFFNSVQESVKETAETVTGQKNTRLIK